LKEQLEGSVPAVGLNLAGGWGRRGGNPRQRFETAIGEARETMMALEIAEALECADKIIAQTVRLMRIGYRRSC
jgi:four helix bundle protein